MGRKRSFSLSPWIRHCSGYFNALKLFKSTRTIVVVRIFPVRIFNKCVQLVHRVRFHEKSVNSTGLPRVIPNLKSRVLFTICVDYTRELSVISSQTFRFVNLASCYIAANIATPPPPSSLMKLSNRFKNSKTTYIGI